MSVRDPELAAFAAKAKRGRRLPSKAACATCGVVERLAIDARGDVRCYAHLGSNADAVELDHWLGRVTSPDTVIPLRANAHRRVTDLRRIIGFDDLAPVNGDPLLLLARILEAIASLLVLFAEWLVVHVAAVNSGVARPPFPVAP